MLVSAPSDGADLTVCYGVNHEKLKPEHKVVSNASCTTNCLAPVAKVLHDAVGIERGHMTTIHSFTNDQNLLDVFHKDLHRARAATMSLIPTSTGAANAVGLVLPELKGKLDGVAIRVPTPNVSLVDLTFVPKRATTAEEINAGDQGGGRRADAGHARLSRGAAGLDRLQPRRHSSTVDSTPTKVIDGGLVRVPSWYDNEWGFSNRMSDTAALLGSSERRSPGMARLPHPRRPRSGRQDGAGARRPQRADAGRRGHRRHPDRALGADPATS